MLERIKLLLTLFADSKEFFFFIFKDSNEEKIYYNIVRDFWGDYIDIKTKIKIKNKLEFYIDMSPDGKMNYREFN